MKYMEIGGFCLSLAEAKPIAALSRTEQREIIDEAMLDELVMPEINKHRGNGTFDPCRAGRVSDRSNRRDLE